MREEKKDRVIRVTNETVYILIWIGYARAQVPEGAGMFQEERKEKKRGQ
jgi:hypothetical protein